jgi:carboxyl-terminal processing protease
MKIINRIKYLTILFLTGVLIISCQKDDPAKTQTANENNVYVNNWILENMQLWYFWNNQMNTTGDKNTDPDAYFHSLLYSGDRFSWIQDNYQELLNSLKGITKEAGFEFTLYREAAGSDNVIAQIVYVKPNSPASSAGLVRGDVITHINDTHFTVSNYKDLLELMKQNYSIRYKSANPDTKSFGDEKTASLAPVEYTEDPNYLSKVIEVSDKKIGYYVYNFFADGPTATSTSYITGMDNIFQNFKSQGITDLVLDLRFNSGGSETSANNLSSLIGLSVDSSKIFVKKQYNSTVEAEISKLPNSESYFTAKFRTKDANVGSQLSNNRVYILTSHRSASASELVINALKPYMDVYIIGDTTYGKNVGSFSLFEENDPKNTWGMQPIVVKVFNTLNQSDYSEGFVPNIEKLDNSLYIYPLGDTKEVLLAQAIAQITGTIISSREADSPQLHPVGHSIDNKRRSYNLLMDKNHIPAISF